MPRPKKYETHSTHLWLVYFKADAYPAVETTLQLSDLRGGDGNEIDFCLRGAERMTACILKEADVDSWVALYLDRPEEAKWIPVFAELLKTRRGRKRKK